VSPSMPAMSTQLPLCPPPLHYCFSIWICADLDVVSDMSSSPSPAHAPTTTAHGRRLPHRCAVPHLPSRPLPRPLPNLYRHHPYPSPPLALSTGRPPPPGRRHHHRLASPPTHRHHHEPATVAGHPSTSADHGAFPYNPNPGNPKTIKPASLHHHLRLAATPPTSHPFILTF
jgi:hypothetical protein